MKKKSASRSAFFNSRIFLTLTACAIVALIGLLAFALYPGGKALARDNQSSAQASTRQNSPVNQHSLLSTQSVTITDISEGAAPAGSFYPPLNQTLKSPKPHVPAVTFVVNTTADTADATPGDGVCADSGGACSLRAAISENNALGGGNTITLPAGTYTQTLVAAAEDLNAGGDFDIRASVTINGAGSATTIIQANASPGVATERVIHLIGGGTSVTINDVTIQNGRLTTTASGAGIRLEVANEGVTLNRVLITNNQSSGAGGGVTIIGTGQTININDSTISNNNAGSSVASSGSTG